MLSCLLQEAEALKAQLAAMQEARPMTAAQQTMRSPLRSLYGSPVGSVHTALPTVSTAQVCTPTVQHGGRHLLSFGPVRAPKSCCYTVHCKYITLHTNRAFTCLDMSLFASKTSQLVSPDAAVD